MDERTAEVAQNSEREAFLSASLNYLLDRDSPRPLSDGELRRMAAGLGYKSFNKVLVLFVNGLTPDPIKNMRFAVQMTLVAAQQAEDAPSVTRPTATPVVRHKKLWTRKGSVDATVAFMRRLSTATLPSDTEINIAARRGEMPSTTDLGQLFAKGTGNDGMIHFRNYANAVIGPEIARAIAGDAPSRGLTMSASTNSLT